MEAVLVASHVPESGSANRREAEDRLKKRLEE